MKHPPSNLCVSFIIEYSKSKTISDEEKVCRKYEDILFSHFESPDRLSISDKRSDINMMVSMGLFHHHPAFVGEYMIQLSDSDSSIRNECYMALATLENLGVSFDSSITSGILIDFLESADKEPALNYLSLSKTKLDLSSDSLNGTLKKVLNSIITYIFDESTSIKLKKRALKCLINFCSVLDDKTCLDVLVGYTFLYLFV